MKTIKITRYSQDKNQTLGVCSVFDSSGRPLFSGISLERGWRDNEKGISCIPTGNYDVVLEHSPAFNKKLWEIKGVPNRSECKFHSANYWYQLKGCVALGSKTLDIDKDGYYDVSKSVSSMKDFHKALEGEERAVLIVDFDCEMIL